MSELVREWYYYGPRKQHQGPFAIGELQELITRGKLNQRVRLWREGEKKIRSWSELQENCEALLPRQNFIELARDLKAGQRLNAYWSHDKLSQAMAFEITQDLQRQKMLENRQGHQQFFDETQNWDCHFLGSTISHQQQKLAATQTLDSLQGLRYGVLGTKARSVFLDSLIAQTPQRLLKFKAATLGSLLLVGMVVGLMPWESWRSHIYSESTGLPSMGSDLSERDFQRLQKMALAKGEKPQFELATDSKLQAIYLSSNYQGPLDLMVKIHSRPGEVLSMGRIEAYGEARFMGSLAQLRDIKMSESQALVPGVYDVEIESKDRDSEGRPLFYQRKLVLLGFSSHRQFVPELEKFNRKQNVQELAILENVSQEWKDFYQQMRDFRMRCQDLLTRNPSGHLASEAIQSLYLQSLGPSLSALALRAKEAEDTYMETHPRIALFYRALYDLARAQGEFWSGQWEQIAGNDVWGERLEKNLKLNWQNELIPLEEKAHWRISRLEDMATELRDQL